jgi:mRNA-degrading endonuclease YafQ of YafQ-DinJ toxin-antitoxin module
MPRFDRRSNFRHRYRKLGAAERNAVDRALRWLAADPRDRRLRPHKLEGSERWACSYAYDGRIVFTWEADVITLVDVGTHDEV